MGSLPTVDLPEDHCRLTIWLLRMGTELSGYSGIFGQHRSEQIGRYTITQIIPLSLRAYFR